MRVRMSCGAALLRVDGHGETCGSHVAWALEAHMLGIVSMSY